MVACFDNWVTHYDFGPMRRASKCYHNNQEWLSAFLLEISRYSTWNDFTTERSQWVRMQSVRENSWSFWRCALDEFGGFLVLSSESSWRIKCARRSWSNWKQVRHQRKRKQKQWLKAGTCLFWFNMVLKSLVSLWLNDWTCFLAVKLSLITVLWCCCRLCFSSFISIPRSSIPKAGFMITYF